MPPSADSLAGPGHPAESPTGPTSGPNATSAAGSTVGSASGASSIGSTASTRDLLGTTLKDHLTRLPLSKVTVSGLTQSAGVTRQTFYYHFADVYELAVWVFEQEVANHIMAHASYAQWSDGFLQMLVYMRENREQTYAVIDSLSHEELEAFFFRSLREMMTAVVAEVQGDLELPETDRAFVIDHYTLSVLGHFLHWLATDMRADPYILVEEIEVILHGSTRASLERFAERARRLGRMG